MTVISLRFSVCILHCLVGAQNSALDDWNSVSLPSVKACTAVKWPIYCIKIIMPNMERNTQAHASVCFPFLLVMGGLGLEEFGRYRTLRFFIFNLDIL